MKNLMHTNLERIRAADYVRDGRFTAFTPPRARLSTRATCSTPRRRSELIRGVSRALCLARDLVLVLWTTAALAILLTVVAGFVLR